MVEVVERTALLALMRRLRRRRRWMAALQTGAATVAIVTVCLAALVLLLRGTSGVPIGGRVLTEVVMLALAIGAGVGAARRISLASCARAVDRATARRRQPDAQMPASDDCVLAAMTLLDPLAAGARFVDALVAEATRRARAVPPRDAVPLPGQRRITFAVAGLATLLIVSAAPVIPGRVNVKVAAPGTGMARPGAKEKDVATPVVRLSAVELQSEREDAARAIQVAQQSGDLQLRRAAEEFQQLVTTLSAAGVAPAGAVDQLEELRRRGAMLAATARSAQMAAEAARRMLDATRARGGGAGTAADALATAIDGGGPTADAAARAAARLAAAGPTGQAGLADAAAGAARSLAESRVPSPNGSSPAQNVTAGRRLTHANDGTEPWPASSRGDTADGDATERRRLEQLRRDLEDEEKGCRDDAQACGRAAENTGKALSELRRQGSGEDARRRFGQAAQQLLERIRRGEAGPPAPRDSGRNDMLDRFAREARGEAVRHGAAPSSSAGQPGSEQHEGGPGSGGEGERERQLPPPSAGAPAQADSAQGGTEAGAAAAGMGMGTQPGGPVLGARAGGGRRAGRPTEARLANDGSGITRAQVINGAAARGFAAAGYQAVFADYQAAVEETTEANDIPASKRYLVRRYFQMIRPRSVP